MQAGVHIGERPKQIAALQRKPAACLFHEGTPAPSSGLHGGDISFWLHSSYVFTLRHRSAPGFIPGEKPPVSLVFPTEIEHYSCFRLYSGLRKISPGTPFPEGKHRKRGILNLQLFIFCQISGICYFQLLQGMRLLTAVAQHPNISSALPFPGRRRGGRNGGFPSGKRSEIPGNIAQRPRSPHLKQPSGQQENRGSNKPRQTAKPQLEI